MYSESFLPYSNINVSEVGNRISSPMWDPDFPAREETRIEAFGPMSGWQHDTPPGLVMLHERLHSKTTPLNCPCNKSVQENFEMPDGYVPNDYMHHELYQQPVSPYCPNNIRPTPCSLEAMYRYPYQGPCDGQTDGMMQDQMAQMMAMPEKEKKHHYLLLLIILILIIVLLSI